MRIAQYFLIILVPIGRDAFAEAPATFPDSFFKFAFGNDLPLPRSPFELEVHAFEQVLATRFSSFSTEGVATDRRTIAPKLEVVFDPVRLGSGDIGDFQLAISPGFSPEVCDIRLSVVLGGDYFRNDALSIGRPERFIFPKLLAVVQVSNNDFHLRSLAPIGNGYLAENFYVRYENFIAFPGNSRGHLLLWRLWA